MPSICEERDDEVPSPGTEIPSLLDKVVKAGKDGEPAWDRGHSKDTSNNSEFIKPPYTGR